MINEAISSILQQEAEAVRNIPITSGYEEAVTAHCETCARTRWKPDHQRYGQSRADRHEHRDHLLFDRHARLLPASQRSAAWRPRHCPQKRYHVAHLQFRQDTRTARTGGVDARPRAGDAFIVITGNPDSPLAAEATICLPNRCAKEVAP